MIELSCGGDADPFTLPRSAKNFLCSKGCSHPVSEDHRALLAEYAERDGVNYEIANTKQLGNRMLRFFQWTGLIAILWGIDAAIKTAAVHPGSRLAGAVSLIEPYFRGFAFAVFFLIVMIAVIKIAPMKIRLH